MSHEPLVYAINLAIASILAAILTEYWRRAGRGSGLGLWASGAWTMAVADLFFALRPWMPLWAVRLLPTHVLGESRARAEAWLATSGTRPRSRLGAVMIAGIWVSVAIALGFWAAGLVAR